MIECMCALPSTVMLQNSSTADQLYIHTTNRILMQSLVHKIIENLYILLIISMIFSPCTCTKKGI